jgi:hypothetical protein
VQLDFYNHNANIAYPLVDLGGSRRLGGLDWRDDILLDCGFAVEARTGGAVLERVLIRGGLVVYRFVLDGLAAELAAAPEAAAGTAIRVRGERWDGFAVLGPGHRTFAGSHEGAIYRLTPALPVEPGCIQWLYDAFVREIQLANRGEGDRSAVPAAAGIGGTVRFRAGRNARVTIQARTNTLELASDPGGGTAGGFRPCLPPALPGISCDGFIRTINGAGPDADGEFAIRGGPGVEVRNYPEEHRIVIDFTKGLADGTCET